MKVDYDINRDSYRVVISGVKRGNRIVGSFEPVNPDNPHGEKRFVSVPPSSELDDLSSLPSVSSYSHNTSADFQRVRAILRVDTYTGVDNKEPGVTIKRYRDDVSMTKTKMRVRRTEGWGGDGGWVLEIVINRAAYEKILREKRYETKAQEFFDEKTFTHDLELLVE